MNPIQVVTVVNDYVQYEHYVKNNPFYQNFDLVHFNNTQENISVPQRYNYFLDHLMSDDAWVMFCHQDFSVNEDLSGKLCCLAKNCIYGPMGIKSYRCLGLILRLKGARAFTIRKKKFFENKQYGQILHQTSCDGSGPKLAGI